MANFEKPYSFNIVLNSYLASPPLDLTNNNNKTYSFNWSNIPQGKYEMTWSYRGTKQITATGDDSPQVFLTFGSNGTSYLAGGNNTNSSVTNYIGNLQTNTHINADLYFYTSQYDNCPIFFENIPTDNMIRVQMFDFDFITPYLSTAVGNEPLSSYVMTLHFEKKR